MSGAIELRTLFHRDTTEEGFVASVYGNHVHQVEQWYCCVAGEIAITIEGRYFPLQAGMGILVPRGLGRSIRRQPGAAYIVALFADLALDLGPAMRRPLAIPDDQRASLTGLVAELRDLGDGLAPQLAEALLIQLLITLRRSVIDDRDHDSRSAAGLVRQVDHILRQNLRRHLTREQVAVAVNLSAPHLARLYKAAAGKTLHERHDELRLAHACGLLADSTMSVGQIGHEVGFRSGSHFSQWFRRATGRSPTAWRRPAPGA